MKEPPISSPQGGALRLFSLSGADFRTHDPGAEDDLALLGAHSRRLQRPLP
jgi:hypothetical protein